MNNYNSNYFDICPVLDVAQDNLSEREKETTERIDKAKDLQEVATIISEALVRSLMDQLEISEAVTNVINDSAHKPKKTHHKRSKEGYMTEQQWQDYFEDRDNGEPALSDTHTLGTEDEFKQIHSGRTIKDV